MAHPIDFPEKNSEFIKPEGWTDAQCGNLPTNNDGKQIISCWKLTWKERFKALVFGNVWLGVAGQSQPPVWITTSNPFGDE